MLISTPRVRSWCALLVFIAACGSSVAQATTQPSTPQGGAASQPTEGGKVPPATDKHASKDVKHADHAQIRADRKQIRADRKKMRADKRKAKAQAKT